MDVEGPLSQHPAGFILHGNRIVRGGLGVGHRYGANTVLGGRSRSGKLGAVGKDYGKGRIPVRLRFQIHGHFAVQGQ